MAKFEFEDREEFKKAIKSAGVSKVFFTVQKQSEPRAIPRAVEGGAVNVNGVVMRSFLVFTASAFDKKKNMEDFFTCVEVLTPEISIVTQEEQAQVDEAEGKAIEKAIVDLRDSDVEIYRGKCIP